MRLVGDDCLHKVTKDQRAGTNRPTGKQAFKSPLLPRQLLAFSHSPPFSPCQCPKNFAAPGFQGFGTNRALGIQMLHTKRQKNCTHPKNHCLPPSPNYCSNPPPLQHCPPPPPSRPSHTIAPPRTTNPLYAAGVGVQKCTELPHMPNSEVGGASRHQQHTPNWSSQKSLKPGGPPNGLPQ